MTWVFAVLVVLVMGGVAVLAAGRGEPMGRAAPDRAVPALPAEDRELTASDLRRVRFPLALRGYRMSDVDALVDRLAREREAHEAFRRPLPEAGADREADREAEREAERDEPAPGPARPDDPASPRAD